MAKMEDWETIFTDNISLYSTTELFSLDITAEALRAIIGSKSAISLQWGPVDTKFRVEAVALTNHSSQKTGLNDLSRGIKMWTDFSSILSQFTRLTDGQTNGRTDRILIIRPRLHSMQRGKNSVRLLYSVCKSHLLFSRSTNIIIA